MGPRNPTVRRSVCKKYTPGPSLGTGRRTGKRRGVALEKVSWLEPDSRHHLTGRSASPQGEPSPRSTGLGSLDLATEGVSSVVWCTGFHGDFSWLQVPAIDADERPMHVRGVSPVPGISSSVCHGSTRGRRESPRHRRRHPVDRRGDSGSDGVRAPATLFGSQVCSRSRWP